MQIGQAQCKVQYRWVHLLGLTLNSFSHWGLNAPVIVSVAQSIEFERLGLQRWFEVIRANTRSSLVRDILSS